MKGHNQLGNLDKTTRMTLRFLYFWNFVEWGSRTAGHSKLKIGQPTLINPFDYGQSIPRCGRLGARQTAADNNFELNSDSVENDCYSCELSCVCFCHNRNLLNNLAINPIIRPN